METLQTQASTLWQLLFSEETANIYRVMLSRTWEILRETARLLWLLFCSVFVLGAWIGKNALAWGRDTRGWLEKQSSSAADSAEKATATSQALLSAGQSGAFYLIERAYEQIGLDKPERPAPVSMPTVPNKKARSASKANNASAVSKPSAAKSSSAKSSNKNTEPATSESETVVKETKVTETKPSQSAKIGEGKAAEEKAADN